MKTVTKVVWALAIVVVLTTGTFTLAAQDPVPLAAEPHHHLVFHNDYVNIFDAKASSGDSLLLHRHDLDAVAIAIGDQMVTVGSPGKADVHQKNADGQVRMQASGYVHSTHVDGDAAYYTVAIELLAPQTSARNLCAVVLAGQPLHCPTVEAASATQSSSPGGLPEFESDQTHAQLVRVLPHRDAVIAPGSRPELIIMLDPGSVSSSTGGANETLPSGKFIWLDKGGLPRMLHNQGDRELRYIEFTFQPIVH